MIREFLDDPHAPEANVNAGVTDSVGEPFKSWVDVAGFVDVDELGFGESGVLWVYSGGVERGTAPDRRRDSG